MMNRKSNILNTKHNTNDHRTTQEKDSMYLPAQVKQMISLLL